MNPFAISGLLLGITIFPLGIFVLLKNRRSRVNQTLALFCFAGALWGFGGYKIATIPETQPELALFWYRQITYVGITLIPTFLWHFIHVFLELKKRKLLYFVYLWAFFFIVFIQSPWADSFFGLSNNTLRFRFDSFFWPSPPTPGLGFPTPLFAFYTLCWFAIIIYCHYELYKAFKNSSGLKRTQIKYLFLAALVGFSGGGTCFLSPFGINLYPILNFTTPFYPLIVAYAILRYRLMDIRLAIGRGAVYFLSFTTMIALGLLFAFLNNQLAIPISASIAFPLITIIVILIFQPIFRLFERIAARYFYYTFYSFQTVLVDLANQLNQTIELDKLVNLLNRSLLDALKLEKIGIVLREPKEKILKPQVLIGFSPKDILDILNKEDGFLLQYLQRIKKPIIREEIPSIIKRIENIEERLLEREVREDERRLDIVEKEMQKTEVALFLPLFIEEELIGIIILGEKLSGEAYTVQDLNLLSALASQAAIAFNNALSYAEIEKRKADLEKFYKLTVGRELKMVELKKKIGELEKEREKWEGKKNNI